LLEVKPIDPPPSRPRLPRCPCCGAAGSSTFLFTIPYHVIWTLLAEEWQAIFSVDVIRRHTPAEVASLLLCRECGLQFFDPPSAGDEDFYRELGGSPLYYSPWKWEFGWVRERLSRGMDVLDVGCGRGDFLAHIESVVRRAAGLEQNTDAAAAAAARGLEVTAGGLAEYAERNVESFDAVCAFHVVEHLTDVVPFLRHLSRCLRPGGQVFLSVPNRARYYRKPVEPLDCPPHHLSRWEPVQLRRLGDLVGLRVLEISIQPVDVNMIREEIPAGIRRRLETIPAAGGFLGRWSTRILARTLFRKSLRSWYERSGIFDRMGFQGANVAVRYAKAESRRGGERGK